MQGRGTGVYVQVVILKRVWGRTHEKGDIEA